MTILAYIFSFINHIQSKMIDFYYFVCIMK